MIYSLAVTGPTASGKTALSIEIAKALDSEIICCDSMQIYRDMDIGTAKPTAEERAMVRHHMVDFLSPSEPYSAENYKAEALRVAEDIQSRGKIPIFVGGTGLYIDTVMRVGMSGVPESSREYSEAKLREVKTEEDAHALWEYLLKIDPDSASQIHENNVRRVIRAIEIYERTGKTKSYFDALAKRPDDNIRVGMITLDFHNRENLYNRVDLRVDKMMEEGLLSEVEKLYSAGALDKRNTASQAIGYKEIVEHLEGRMSLAEAVELIKLSSRRYAKRQLTWFRHEEEAVRLYIDNPDGSMRASEELIEEAETVVSDLIKRIKEI